MKTGLPYTWTSPLLRYDEMALDSSDSIPLGNGDIGMNLWVEKNGDLLFYISKSDSISENNQLLKIGRIRVSFSHNPFREKNDYLLELNIEAGVATISCKNIGFQIEVWIDAHSPNIWLKSQGQQAFDYSVSLENWRKYPRDVYIQAGSPWDFQESGTLTTENPSNITKILPDFIEDRNNKLLWGHQNPERTYWDDSVEMTWQEDYKDLIPNPLKNLISGCQVQSSDLVSKDAHTLTTQKPVQTSLLQLTCHCEQTPHRQEWEQHLHSSCTKPQAYDSALKLHKSWWKEKSDRHYIVVKGSEEAEHASMCYALQRYVTLCAGRGKGPIHFNGSIFTVDWKVDHHDGKSESYNADYRRWGNTILMQNTRWAYWTMINSGDFECLAPFFKVYIDALPSSRERCKHYCGVDGIHFQDCISEWGVVGSVRGMSRFNNPKEYLDASWSANYISPILELLMMAMDYQETSGDQDIISTLIEPASVLVARYYLYYFAKGSDGKLQVHGSALEHYHRSENPLPDIAGLSMVISRFLAMGCTNEDNKKESQKLLDALPVLPLGKVSDEYKTMQDRIEDRWIPLGLPLDRPEKVGQPDEPVLAPAGKVLSEGWNVENPELYAIFPYRHHCVLNGDLELAKRSFHNRIFHHDWGWAQDPIQSAMLGQTQDAKERLMKRYHQKFEKASFPVFWTANFDWIPDQDNGNVANKTMQTMLIQYHLEHIALFPAWPLDWDVEFKLYAPQQTIIEGQLKNGKLMELKVTPERRRKNIQIPEALMP